MNLKSKKTLKNFVDSNKHPSSSIIKIKGVIYKSTPSLKKSMKKSSLMKSNFILCTNYGATYHLENLSGWQKEYSKLNGKKVWVMGSMNNERVITPLKILPDDIVSNKILTFCEQTFDVVKRFDRSFFTVTDSKDISDNSFEECA